MGYMEMKRVNQELLSEVQSLRESSESKERKRLNTITQLAQEIAEQKVGDILSKGDKGTLSPSNRFTFPFTFCRGYMQS